MLLHENNQLPDINSFFAANQALSESENLQSLLEYRKLIQTSLDGFWVVRTKDARILEANDAFCNIVGYSREELMTMSISDLEIDESPAETAAHIKKIMAIGCDRFETRCRHKQGHQVNLEVSVSHSEFDGGTNYVFARDITARKRMELAIAAREQEFRSMAESSPDFIVRYDREGRHLYLNDRLLKLLGLASMEEVIGKRPGEVWADGRFAELEQAAVRAVASGSQVDIEFVQLTASGAFRYDQIFIVPERDVSGQIVGTIAFGREITAIREAERKLSHFIANLPGMAYTFQLSPDGHACFPFISPSIEKFYGLKSEDVQDDIAPLHSLWHPDDRTRIEAAAAESARTMTPFRIESRVCRPGQPERWFDVRAMPEHEADGSIIWYGLMLDITERKRKEALLHSQSRKLKAISRCDQILVRAENEQELLNGVCKLVCDETGYLMAWVGFAENDEHKTVRPVAHSGYEEGYLDGIQITWADTERGQVPIGIAIRTGVAAINHDFQTYPGLAPWREAVKRRGFRSSAAIPLVSNGQVLGSLNIYSAEPQAFENAEVELLQELANDIAYGIKALRVRTENKRTEAALHASERESRRLAQFQHSLLSGMLDAGVILVVVENGRFVYTNDHYVGCQLGYAKGQLPETVSFINLIHPDDRPRIAEMHRDRLAGKPVPTSYEIGALAGDGSRLEYEFHVTVVPDTDPPQTLLLALDIGGRKRMEMDLQRRELEFRTLAENMPDNLIRYDRQCRVQYMNPALRSSLAPEILSVLGESSTESYPGNDAVAEYQRVLERVIATGDAAEKEILVPNLQGEICTHHIRFVAERDDNGEIVGALAIGRDMTERYRMEKEIAKSEAALRSLTDYAPFSIIRYDLEGRMRYMNSPLLQYFGIPAAELIGKLTCEVWPDECFAEIEQGIAHVLKTKAEIVVEFSELSAEGKKLHHQVWVVPEKDTLGEVVGIIAFGLDITTIREAERQLRELTAHLLTVREEEKAYLAREIHDDLGSTLAALNLKLLHLLDVEFSEDMKKKPLFARLESMLPLLGSSIATTRRIITDMRPDVLDNLGLFAALKWQAEQFYKHTDIVCRIVCTNDHGCEDCKECEYQLGKTLSINLFRIFQESLTNVSRHSGASGVEAEFHNTESAVVLSIRDNGRGLPEGHTIAATSYGIRGMRERIRQMGGEIEFDSPPDGGFSVIVRVPRLFAS